MEDKQIDNYINNDKLDLDKLVDTFTPYIKKIVDNMARNELSFEDKEEILADVFFVLWKNQDKDIMYLDSYIAGITRNLIKEKFKKKKITFNIEDYENIIEYENINLFCEERGKIEEIEKCCSKLKELDYKIVNMFYYSSKSTKEIAERLNISENNTRKRLFRIRNKIKKELGIGG